jgi:acyl-CoA reductase-like NAD-dependent aldehyde dehydrogenase
VAQVAAGSEADIDVAVRAAHSSFYELQRDQPRGASRAARRHPGRYKRRLSEIAAAMTTRRGIPKSFSEKVQACIGTASGDRHQGAQRVSF